MQPAFDDIQTMQRIEAQDQQAFRALYQEYGKAVYSLAYRILMETTLAEDVTQETFLKIWQGKALWDPRKGKLRNWLLAITHFTAVDRLRHERRQPNLHPDPIDEMEERVLGAQEDRLGQDGAALRLLVADLPQEQARLIELAFFQGMSHSEIAQVTRLPLGTVKTRLRSGIQRLRELWVEGINPPSSPAKHDVL